MKIKHSFITNSSSSSYIISNLSLDKELTLDRFIDIIWSDRDSFLNYMDDINIYISKDQFKKQFITFFIDCFPVPPDTKCHFVLYDDNEYEYSLIEYLDKMKKLRKGNIHIDSLGR